MLGPALGLAILLLAAMLGAAIARPAETATVVEAIDGDTLRLADGRQVRLVGVQAPKLPLGRPGFEAWPLADAAQAALAERAVGRAVRLDFTGLDMDRHGRLLAHAYDAEDGGWLQGEMLRRGLTRVYSFADNRALIPEMLAIEREARAAGRGIWGDPFYRVIAPEEAEGAIDSFQLVEGRILAAAIVNGRGYLNFGEDWRTDFTLVVEPGSRRLFEEAGIDVAGLAGVRVRARGWIKSFNGPMIELTHPEQLEILAE